MEDSRRTYSVLVVAAAAKFHMSLREMLPEDRYDPVCAAGSVSEARRALLERPFDIVVISTPLPDEFGTKLALHIIDKSSAGVLLLVKAEHYPDLARGWLLKASCCCKSPPRRRCCCNPCSCCAAHGSACGVWRKRLPPSRNAWRRYGW